MLETLGEFLDRMQAAASATEAHLRAAGPAGADDLARARAEQARVIASYQLFVHRALFEPIVAGGAPGAVSGVRALKSECILLAEEHRGFARCWNSEAMAARWPDYRVAGLAFAARIRGHVDHVRATAPGYLPGRAPPPGRSHAG